MKDAPAPSDDPWQSQEPTQREHEPSLATPRSYSRKAQILQIAPEESERLTPSWSDDPALPISPAGTLGKTGEDAASLNLAPVADQLSAIAELLRTGRLGALSRITGFIDQGGDERLPASSDKRSHEGSIEVAGAARHLGEDAEPQSRPRLVHQGAALPAPAFARDNANLRSRFAELARQAYLFRRRRATVFGVPDLFGEPAWDIMLDLYIAHADAKPVSVSSACIGSACPPTTGLRWLGVLARHDLIVREHDPEDQRRTLVRLSEKGLETMDGFFASVFADNDRRATGG